MERFKILADLGDVSIKSIVLRTPFCEQCLEQNPHPVLVWNSNTREGISQLQLDHRYNRYRCIIHNMSAIQC